MLKNTSGNAPAEVTRIICTSVSRVKGSVMNELFEVRNRICEPGRDTSVRGALLYSRGWFVLWLEGPDAEVEAALKRAAADPRNADQVVIHRSRGPACLTEPVTVVSTQGEGPSAFAQRISYFRRQHELGVPHEPAAIWRQLSAPCTFAPHFGREPDHHVALVSAYDNGAIDLLRRLGERHASHVVYQRFAKGQPHSSDVGVAYVDLAAGEQIRRVQLLSRRALGQDFVRQSVTGLDAMALLLGDSTTSAIDLGMEVAACVRAMPATPDVYLVAQCEAITAAVRQVLAQGSQANPPAAPAMHLPEAHLAEFLAGSWQAYAATGLAGLSELAATIRHRPARHCTRSIAC